MVAMETKTWHGNFKIIFVFYRANRLAYPNYSKPTRNKFNTTS